MIIRLLMAVVKDGTAEIYHDYNRTPRMKRERKSGEIVRVVFWARSNSK